MAAATLRIVIPVLLLTPASSPPSSPRCASPQALTSGAATLRLVAPLRDHLEDQDGGDASAAYSAAALASARERVLGTRLGSPRRLGSRAVSVLVPVDDETAANARDGGARAVQEKRRGLLGCRHGTPLRCTPALAAPSNGPQTHVDAHKDRRWLLLTTQQARLPRLALGPAGELSGGDSVAVGVSGDSPVTLGSPSGASAAPGIHRRRACVSKAAARVHRRAASVKEPLAPRLEPFTISGASSAGSTSSAGATSGINSTRSIGNSGSNSITPPSTMHTIDVPMKAFTGSPCWCNQREAKRARSDVADR